MSIDMKDCGRHRGQFGKREAMGAPDEGSCFFTFSKGVVYG
jgi:hypothetical protein